MSIFLTIIAFIVIFSVLVLVHELGHFIVARKCGIKVEEFGFGIPPRIWGVKKGETLYSINAIPFGGFVKLLGEDAHDSKMLKNPHSFSSKSLRARMAVVLAGVVMNFILAFLLLTIGFLFGIQPLILNGDDVLNDIQDGTIQVQPGVAVKNVKAGSAAQIAGLQIGDLVLSVDGHQITTSEEMAKITQSIKQQVVEVLRGGQKTTLTLQANPQGTGFEVYEIAFLPSVKVHAAPTDSVYYQAGLRAGDIILKINDREIFAVSDFDAAVQSANDLRMVIARDGQIVNFQVALPVTQRVVVSDVFPNTPAEKVGFKIGDVISKIDDQVISFPQQLIDITHKSANKKLTYTFLRDDKEQKLDVTPDATGLVGVGLSVLEPYQNRQISLFGIDNVNSVIKINDVRYPFLTAASKALSESGRLSVLTVQMFGNVIGSFVTKFTIPEGVAGPVGIAQMTFVFVQEGIMSLLRFMALLSLSLAIINVLPFPALDGGRLLFLVIEMIIGRRLSARYEGIVHTIGFVILMGLILAVTYSDILKIF